MWNFAHMGNRNPLRDRDQILHVVDIRDIITYVTFGDDRLRGLGMAGVEFPISPLTCIIALTTLLHYRASVWANDNGSGGDNWSYKSCKAPVKSSPPTNQHPVLLRSGCHSCRPTNSVKALKGKIPHPMDLITPNSPGVFQLCFWPWIVPGYLGGGLPCLISPLMQTEVKKTEHEEMNILERWQKHSYYATVKIKFKMTVKVGFCNIINNVKYINI